MLGEGVRAALEHFGIGHRTVCYVEREASAAAQLVALMEAGALDQAPIWSDLLTFDGSAWRGSVDCVIAGFPCQDISVAGRRAGLDGKRSGLFFNVVDIAAACGAWLLVLENVSGIVSATASVVDEEDGELLERAASRVVGELADRGWHAEWTHLRASDVGGSHQRERWFCVAWRVADAVRHDGDDIGRSDRRGRRVLSAGDALGDSGLQPKQLQQRTVRAEHPGTGGELADACSAGRQQVSGGVQAHANGEVGPDRRSRGDDQLVAGEGAGVGDAACDGRHEGRSESAGKCGRSNVAEHGCAMVDAQCSERRPLRIGGRGCEPWQDGERQATSRPRIGDEALGDAARVDGDERLGFGKCATSGTGSESGPEGSGDAVGDADSEGSQGRCDDARERGGEWSVGPAGIDELFAPGPLDQRWSGIVAERPDLAPAIKPGVRVLANGMARLVDESRNHQLRQIGNGVVPLQAATALVLLFQRAGLRVTHRKDQP
ncbi:DNA cytosine methyltransferase [Burkholderia cenocepacia]|uniref:DNA cytosine methyltransferase n=1 Tax=Burkholderia cenocepacia TaxID=95486 RepID=UPI0012B38CDA|nr:DNA cytosine methyltransferase [Burkholderia cenocepacia]